MYIHSWEENFGQRIQERARARAWNLKLGLWYIYLVNRNNLETITIIIMIYKPINLCENNKDVFF